MDFAGVFSSRIKRLAYLVCTEAVTPHPVMASTWSLSCSFQVRLSLVTLLQVRNIHWIMNLCRSILEKKKNVVISLVNGNGINLL